MSSVSSGAQWARQGVGSASIARGGEGRVQGADEAGAPAPAPACRVSEEGATAEERLTHRGRAAGMRPVLPMLKPDKVGRGWPWVWPLVTGKSVQRSPVAEPRRSGVSAATEPRGVRCPWATARLSAPA